MPVFFPSTLFSFSFFFHSFWSCEIKVHMALLVFINSVLYSILCSQVNVILLHSREHLRHLSLRLLWSLFQLTRYPQFIQNFIYIYRYLDIHFSYDGNYYFCKRTWFTATQQITRNLPLNVINTGNLNPTPGIKQSCETRPISR